MYEWVQTETGWRIFWGVDPLATKAPAAPWRTTPVSARGTVLEQHDRVPETADAGVPFSAA